MEGEKIEILRTFIIFQKISFLLINKKEMGKGERERRRLLLLRKNSFDEIIQILIC